MTWRKKEIAEQVEKDNEPEQKPLEVVFMPGCFDAFEGSQEELDEIIALIQSKVEDGSILTDSTVIGELTVDDEFMEEYEKSLNRKLQ
jgi:hypothetical protein